MAELMAITWGMETALKIKVNKMLIQSDASNMVDCINGSKDSAVINPIADDCRMFFRNFSFCSVMFISKHQNILAHNLVRVCKALGSSTWLGECPLLDFQGSFVSSLGS
ncbi:unnamed protein product [Lathyrus sativus]|nr:unnamed protein product [Lathyrus sativus]